MLENEPTGDAQGNASNDHASVGADQASVGTAEASPPRRRRRAASRPAGPPEPLVQEPVVHEPVSREPVIQESASREPVTEPSVPAGTPVPPENGAEPAPAAADRPARPRRTRKKAAAASEPPLGAESGAEVGTASVPADQQSGSEPVVGEVADSAAEPERPKRRRTRKQAQAVPDAVTAPPGEAPAASTAGSASVPASVPASVEPSHPDLEGETTDSGTATDEAIGPNGGRPAGPLPAVTFQAPTLIFQPPEPEQAQRRRTRKRAEAEPVGEPEAALEAAEEAAGEAAEDAELAEADAAGAGDGEGRPARRRRRGGRGRRSRGRDEDAADETGDEAGDEAGEEVPLGDEDAEQPAAGDDEDDDGTSASTRRRRRRRRRGSGTDAVEAGADDPPNTVVKVREPRRTRATRTDDRADDLDEVQSIKGSTRLEAKKQRRREGREQGRRRAPIITEAEFLARRESVERVMVVRQIGGRTQIAVLEDGVLVEHYVNRETAASYVGNVYLGKVQNVLPSMEAAFVDIGKGRNAVLYAGEVNFDAAGLEGHPKRIEAALKSGQSVLVQVTKDPIGHKGARLTSQISLPGRYLVYVPDGSMTGISRKLPDTERSRLKTILKKVVPDDAGVIVRTAAEGASEDELYRDVTRLAAQWDDIRRKSQTANPPALLYGEPDLTVRVIRDIFNEDFSSLVVSGDDAWDTVHPYVSHVAPDLVPRLKRWTADTDVFAEYRIDEQLTKALDRKVWLPSGGSLVIDRTEAMVVVDVNTGKFTGKGGNLEETVTKNNLEAAEEIVRQLRLRDLGGIIVIDFIDMVLESNRDLVLRRLLECLGRDRTKHQVAEVTSLGLVQMTRKRVGQGLLEAFSETCECCNGRGVHIRMDQPVEQKPARAEPDRGRRRRGRGGDRAAEAAETEAAETATAETATADATTADATTAGAASTADAVPPAGGDLDADSTRGADSAARAGRASGAVAVAEAVAEPILAVPATDGAGQAEALLPNRLDDAAVAGAEQDGEDETPKPRSADDPHSVVDLLEPDVEPISSFEDAEPKSALKRVVKRVTKKAEASAPAKKAAKKAEKPAKRVAKRPTTAPAEPE